MKDFPDIHMLSIAPRTAVVIWGIAALAIYSAVAIAMLRSSPRKQWAWDGVIFVVYSMLEPYAVKSGLISLGPAALIAGCLFTLGTSDGGPSMAPDAKRGLSWANRLFLAACLISFGEAVLQYKPWQRILLSVGLDFWAEVLLLAAFLIWILRTPLAERGARPSGRGVE
jgi:hypothetical protein